MATIRRLAIRRGAGDAAFADGAASTRRVFDHDCTAGGGTYLARGGKNVGIDGEPPKPRTVIIAFDSLEKAQATFTGAAYREGRKIGDKYAKFRIWAMEGIAK